MALPSITLAPEPRRRQSRTWMRRIRREHVFGVLSPLALLVLWQVLTQAGVLDERIFSQPTQVVQIIWQLLKNGELPSASAITLRRLGLGLLAGGVPGLALGLLMGISRNARAIINPIVSATYPLPQVAMFPLVLLIVGLNDTSIIIMVALGPFFTMLITTMGATMNVNPVYLRVARSFKVKRRDIYLKVLIPAALPIIFSGIRLSVGLSLLGVVAAEFLVASNGLGYEIWHSWQILSLPESMAALVTAGLIGFLLLTACDVIQRLALPHQPSRHQSA